MIHSKTPLILLFVFFILFQSIGQERPLNNDVPHHLLATYGAEKAEAMILRLNDFELISNKKILLDQEYEERKSRWLQKLELTNDEALRKQIENRLNLFIPFSAVAEQIIGKP